MGGGYASARALHVALRAPARAHAPRSHHNHTHKKTQSLRRRCRCAARPALDASPSTNLYATVDLAAA